MTSTGMLMVGLAGAFFAFELLACRLDIASQPERLELARKGEAFLRRDGLHPSVREHIEYLLDSAFGTRIYLILCLAATPVLVFIALFSPRVLARMGYLPISNHPSTAIAFRDLCRLHYRVSLASHPILRPLAQLEMVIITTALLLRSAVTGVLAPSIGGVETIVVALGEWLQRMFVAPYLVRQ